MQGKLLIVGVRKLTPTYGTVLKEYAFTVASETIDYKELAMLPDIIEF